MALYTAVAAVSAPQAIAAAAITLGVLLGCTAIGSPFGPTGGGFILVPALVVAALFAGLAASNRRAYIASISARAQDEARRRVDEERLRIARELHDVVATTNRAGLDTTLRVAGIPRRLTATVDLAAYRIIQESLTNAIRHAGPASATVGLGYDEAGLRVEVADTGRGLMAAARPVPGHGLIGMRERAASVGGTLEAGPGPDGGFRVAARFPAAASPAIELTPADPANGAGTAHVDHGAPP